MKLSRTVFASEVLELRSQCHGQIRDDETVKLRHVTPNPWNSYAWGSYSIRTLDSLEYAPPRSDNEIMPLLSSNSLEIARTTCKLLWELGR